MFDTFIKIDGIDGESLDDKHKDWIEVMSYSHGLRQPASHTVSSLGGGTTGRVEFDDFVIVKGLDKASPKLYEACAKGTHIPNIVVEFCRAGGDKLCYMKVEMTDSIISGVSPSGSASGASNFPTESVHINPGKIKWTYTQQDRSTGQAKGQVQTMWDLKAGKS